MSLQALFGLDLVEGATLPQAVTLHEKDVERILEETAMTVHIVRLGTPRLANEGLRIGTVRRPPRGVPTERFASENWYDVWFPNLAPSVETMHLGRSAQTERETRAFQKKYRAEMAQPDARRTLDLLAALSHTADFSVGCYCEDESRCHRAVLRQLLAEHGANVS